MIPSNIYQKRLHDLADHIEKDMELLNNFEDELRSTTDPRTMARYRQDIERQKESVNKYEQEFNLLQQQLKGSLSSQTQIQQVGNLLQSMDGKLNVLLMDQVAISKNLNQMRQELLSRYEDTEKKMIAGITEQLSQPQLALTQKLLEALEANQLLEPDMQQMLAALEQRISALPSSQTALAEIIKASELDIKHKLKISLPIIPLLVNYEGELGMESGFNLKSVWEDLIAKLRRSK
jgi:hypothetical protein